MFERRQQAVESLLNSNDEFRWLFNKHHDIHKRVELAEEGDLPLDDLTLAQMKKEKLSLRDRLTEIMNTVPNIPNGQLN